jgi:hypothetical protein
MQYMMQETGCSTPAAKKVVPISSAITRKSVQEAPEGVPTITQVHAAPDKEWEGKARESMELEISK